MDSLQQLEQHRRDLLGSGKPERQHEKGKLTADERLNLLFDTDTFVEYNVFQNRSRDLEKPCARDGVIAGCGKINGRYAYAYAHPHPFSNPYACSDADTAPHRYAGIRAA